MNPTTLGALCKWNHCNLVFCILFHLALTPSRIIHVVARVRTPTLLRLNSTVLYGETAFPLNFLTILISQGLEYEHLILNPGPSLTGCVTLGKLPNPSVPQFCPQ